MTAHTTRRESPREDSGGVQASISLKEVDEQLYTVCTMLALKRPHYLWPK
jgi:hypothetical protein